MIDIAVADTNILIHLYRSNMQNLMFDIFKRVEFHEEIRNELERNAPDVLETMQSDLRSGKLRLITNEYLRDMKLFSVFKAKLNELNKIFLPSDYGEQCAIALAQTQCITTILTDDTKDDGPYYTINRGLCEDMDIALGFWELIYLSWLCNYIPDIVTAEQTYNQIANNGYTPPYRSSFRSKMKSCLRWFGEEKSPKRYKNWYINWCKHHGVDTTRMAMIVNDIRYY